MKKSHKDPEGYYAVSAVVAVILTITIHYFFLSNFNIHSTLHVSIGIGIFFLLSAMLSSILSRFW